MEEATIVLKNMSNNKSPGTDGFTKEFKVFGSKLVILLLDQSILDTLNLGELSFSQKQGDITCIPKEGES